MNLHHDTKSQNEKHWLAIQREKNDLWKRRQEMPPIPVDPPYRQGWKKYFALTERAQNRRDVALLLMIMGKINRVQYHWHRSFRGGKRTRRRTKQNQPLELRTISKADAERWNWPDIWQNYFNCVRGKYGEMEYRFALQHLVEIRVRAHFVTCVAALDPGIEKRLSELESKLSPIGYRVLDQLHGRYRWRNHKSGEPDRQQARFNDSWRQQVQSLKDEGVLIEVFIFKTSATTPSHRTRTSSIEGMQRAFNAQSRERYPGGPPIKARAVSSELLRC